MTTSAEAPKVAIERAVGAAGLASGAALETFVAQHYTSEIVIPTPTASTATATSGPTPNPTATVPPEAYRVTCPSISAARATTEADAASYAASLFGAAMDEEEIAGRTAYWNDCFDADAQCTPAAAISSEPHLMVFTWRRPVESREMFRAMLERAIEAELIP